MYNSNSVGVVRFRFNIDSLIGFLFVFYFCDDAFGALVLRLAGGGWTFYAFNSIFWAIVIICCFAGRINDLNTSILLYVCISLLLLLTLLLHPEYNSWFFSGNYSIRARFINARGGIWAFLVVSLVVDREKLFKNLSIAVWVAFFFYTLQFVAAMRRGYWISGYIDGVLVTGSYNLAFGYSMLFPVVYFALRAYLGGEKKYYLPFLIGAAMILLGGSRGALICIFLSFLVALPFKWDGMRRRQRIWTVLLIIFLLPVFGLLYFNFDRFISLFYEFLLRIGLSSRSIEKLLNGTFDDSNGRDQIWNIVIQLIKTGGPFGRGIYGERLAVGRYFRWGYAHNIALEILCSFGYVGGSVVLIALVICIIKTYKNCLSRSDQIVFLTFLGSSFKLLLSDSFWYCAPFWGLLAAVFKFSERRLNQN